MNEPNTETPTVEFEITRHPRNGPNNTIYQILSLSWNVPTMVKGLADCGNANDPRNVAFAEWVKAKLEAAQAAGEHLPFLCRRD